MLLWPLRWLFSVTFWLLFGHERLYFIIFYFPFKRPPWFSFENARKTRVSSSAQLPAVLFMTASDIEKKNEMKNQLLPRFCESMGDQILSLFCVYCSTRRSRMGVLLGCMTRLLGYFLSAVFFCYLLVRHWDKLLLSFPLSLSLYFLIDKLCSILFCQFYWQSILFFYFWPSCCRAADGVVFMSNG